MGGRVRGELSQAPRAVRRRAATAAAKLVDSPGDPLGDPFGDFPAAVSTDPIVVDTPAKPPALTESEIEVIPPAYVCANCKSEVQHGDSHCGTCETRLAWDGL